jgi:hypothetical protein
MIHGMNPVQHIYWDRAMPATRTGVIDHLACSARDLKEFKARFHARGLKYELRRQADAGTWQLFRHDPNDARVELDFEASETP